VAHVSSKDQERRFVDYTARGAERRAWIPFTIQRESPNLGRPSRAAYTWWRTASVATWDLPHDDTHSWIARRFVRSSRSHPDRRDGWGLPRLMACVCRTQTAAARANRSRERPNSP